MIACCVDLLGYESGILIGSSSPNALLKGGRPTNDTGPKQPINTLYAIAGFSWNAHFKYLPGEDQNDLGIAEAIAGCMDLSIVYSIARARGESFGAQRKILCVI